ncbi:MAG: transketolase family protein [Bacteroidales bacterium]|nr:transketolase family protein [Bacteroidales bacterium]
MKQYTDQGKKDTRSGFGEGLLQAGRENPQIVALAADLRDSVKMGAFAAEFPQRFFQCGIAEANMVGAAAGLAITGKVPFIGSFAEFVTARVYDQLRQEVCYSHTNVKIASSHAGITLGEDGATHQTMEDVALMRALPGMTVIVPCDFNQTRNATLAVARHIGPVYLRFGRPAVPNFTDPDEPFRIGKAYVMTTGSDLTILCYGHLVWECLQAARILEEQGISAEVINVATIKPLDKETIMASAKKTGAVLVAEEHNMAGSLGESVAAVLAASSPCRMSFVNGGDRFGESGSPSELMMAYGFEPVNIAEKAKELLSR